jgi:hypothetical protein
MEIHDYSIVPALRSGSLFHFDMIVPVMQSGYLLHVYLTT